MASLEDVVVGVTGLNASDNPAPGVSVIRSLRDAKEFTGRIVGLTYDGLDAGAYTNGLADDVYLIPYPSQGTEALLDRLNTVREETGLNVVMPTLDSELPGFIGLAAQLRELGIHSFLPTKEQFDLRSKGHLMKLAERAELPTPKTVTLNDEAQLFDALKELDYPLWVKGVFYGARRAVSADEAVAAFHGTVAEWGVPVLLQEQVSGEEFDIAAVGDGEGGLISAVPMKKTFLTDKGKGWAGVTVKDPELLRVTRQFMRASRWRGPCEVEVMRTENKSTTTNGADSYVLLEVNPRFPAWIYLSAGAGSNLPMHALRLALGQEIDLQEAGSYESGTMFVRIAWDQLVPMSEFEQLATVGALHRPPRSTS